MPQNNSLLSNVASPTRARILAVPQVCKTCAVGSFTTVSGSKVHLSLSTYTTLPTIKTCTTPAPRCAKCVLRALSTRWGEMATRPAAWPAMRWGGTYTCRHTSTHIRNRRVRTHTRIHIYTYTHINRNTITPTRTHTQNTPAHQHTCTQGYFLDKEMGCTP